MNQRHSSWSLHLIILNFLTLSRLLRFNINPKFIIMPRKMALIAKICRDYVNVVSRRCESCLMFTFVEVLPKIDCFYSISVIIKSRNLERPVTLPIDIKNKPAKILYQLQCSLCGLITYETSTTAMRTLEGALPKRKNHRRFVAMSPESVELCVNFINHFLRSGHGAPFATLSPNKWVELKIIMISNFFPRVKYDVFEVRLILNKLCNFL